MELRALMSSAARELERNGIAALIFQPRLAPIGIDFLPALIKIFRADMERLMNVGQVVREENHGDRFCYLARIIFRSNAL